MQRGFVMRVVSRVSILLYAISPLKILAKYAYSKRVRMGQIHSPRSTLPSPPIHLLFFSPSERNKSTVAVILSKNHRFQSTRNIKLMGSCNSSSSTVQSRGRIDLIYSTTSGTSKVITDRLQELLEEHKYLANVINIGDYDPQELLESDSTIIFLLSTYGDGASPSDGQKFYDWILKFDPQQRLNQLKYAIIAFGNSSFENHCGFGLKTEKFLKQGGAKELLEITLCDAGSKEKDSDAKFPKWSKQLIEILDRDHPIQEIQRSNLGTSYVASLASNPSYNWELQAAKAKNLRKDVSSFIGMHKAKVVFIKELRQKKEADRSTLHVRLQIDQSVEVWPACNVEVFPINKVVSTPDDQLIVTFNEVKGKTPYPPMPLKEIKKIVNFSQNATNKQIKNAILLAKTSEETLQEYKKKIAEKDVKVTSKKLFEDLNPKIEFLPELGLNTVRTYTLSSWDKDHKYLDLCVALVPNGLTSEYLKTYPEYLRIKTIQSTFYIPEQKRPIVMIANGSGIAPFRSIAQYVQSLAPENRPYLRLYYGIQNADNDFYFGEQWKELQREKIVEVRLAESRKDANRKEYVQNVLQKDVEWLAAHLFERNGVIFMCGGKGMAQDVNNVIFKSLTIQAKLPYKAYSLSAELKRKKVIVEEIYG